MAHFADTPVHNYATAAAFLAGGRDKDSRPLPGKETRLNRRRDGSIAVTYWSTDVVTYHQDGSVDLNTGGYNSMTTRKKMSEFAPLRDPLQRYSHIYTVGSQQGQIVLYLRTDESGAGGGQFPFDRRLTLKPNKEGGYDVERDSTERSPDQIRTLMRQTADYAKRYMQHLMECELSDSDEDDEPCTQREVEVLVSSAEADATYPDHVVRQALDFMELPTRSDLKNSKRHHESYLRRVAGYYMGFGDLMYAPSESALRSLRTQLRRFLRYKVGIDYSR